MLKSMLSIVKKHGSGQVGGESTRDAPLYGEITPKLGLNTSPSGSLAPREWSNLGNNEASSTTEQKICEAIRETRKEHTDTHPSDASKRDNIGPTVCIVRDQRRATEINDAFKVIQSQGSGRIGGESSPDAPLYGEISLGSLDDLVESLKEYCDLGTDIRDLFVFDRLRLALSSSRLLGYTVALLCLFSAVYLPVYRSSFHVGPFRCF